MAPKSGNPAAELIGYGYPEFQSALLKIEARITARRKKAADGRYDVLRIGGIDPGTLTGLTQLYLSGASGKILAWASTILANEEIEQVADMASWVELNQRFATERCPFTLAIEDFKVNKVNGDEEFLSPVRIGRRLEGFLMATQPRLALQIRWFMPARKAEFSDTRLQALGLYAPGPDHRRDAMRHALIARKYLLEARGL